MICEIINPSDPYTLETDEFLPAAAAIYWLGQGKLGLRSEDDKHCTPVLFGWSDWVAERMPDVPAYVRENMAEMASALESVLIGTISERREYIAATALMPSDKVADYKEQRHDRKRSSMNDIWAAASRLAAVLRAKIRDAKG